MLDAKKDQAAFATREEMIQGIVTVLERTYTTAGRAGSRGDLSKFFRALDESTLREIAYKHGVFEGPPEADPDQDDRNDR